MTQKIALVLGGAATVFAEAFNVLDNYLIDYIIAVNNCMQDYPGRIDAAVSLHPSKIADWLENRKGSRKPDRIVSFKQKDRRNDYLHVTDIVPYLWPDMTKSASSGIYGAKVAFDLFKVDKVILAGVPLNGGNHYHNNKDWGTPHDFRAGMLEAMPYLKDRVKSCSGWTAEQLGLPTKEWANNG